MSGPSDYQPTHPALKWIERRLPIMGLVHSSFVAYPTPRNLNYWWTFGAILSMMLGLQVLTGVILAMHYTPHADLAFKSVESIVTLLWGGYSVGNPTLNRFFSLHYLLPFVIAGVVVLHVWALHVAGQNNPAGVEPKTEKDTVPFTPHATIKDLFGTCCFLLLYAWFIFYMPNYLGDADNYIVANPGVT